MLRVEFQNEKVRPWLQLLGHACKMCDSLHFEPYTSTLALRAVNRTKSTHLLIVLNPVLITAYEWNGAEGTTYTVESKALLHSVLRQCNAVGRFVLTHSTASDADDCELLLATENGRGIRRRFALHLDDIPSAKAHLDDDQYGFECLCDAKTWLAFLSSFPPHCSRIQLVPMAQRLSVKFVSDGMSSTAGGGSAESSAAASIESRAFQYFRFRSANASQVSTKSSGPNPVCGKNVEVRALRSFCIFLDQTQLQVRIRMGGIGVPLLLEGIHKGMGPPVLSHCSLLIAAIDCDGAEGNDTSVRHSMGPPRPSAIQNSSAPSYGKRSEVAPTPGDDLRNISGSVSAEEGITPSSAFKGLRPPRGSGGGSEGIPPTPSSSRDGLPGGDDRHLAGRSTLTGPAPAASPFLEGIFPLDFNEAQVDDDDDGGYNAFLAAVYGDDDRVDQNRPDAIQPEIVSDTQQ
jgi:hypothetical protein